MSPAGVRGRLVLLRDALRAQLWPVPTVGILLGLVLGVVLPRLDAHVDPDFSASTSSFIFGGGPSAARTFLGTIAQSLITVTSLTFSLTVVTLQLASSQFSPRLLRTFSRDRLVHVTLALFLGTFTYALVVLRTVRDARRGRPDFVPQVSVTVAFVLTVITVLGLVVFLAHLVRQIRVETMLRNVRGDASATARAHLGRRDDSSVPGHPAPSPPADAIVLTAPRSGFLLQVDEPAILQTAVENDALVRITTHPGRLIVAGTPVGVAWSRSGTLSPGESEELRRCASAALSTGDERTPVQDVGYGLRQLTDVANKALSPGINDPTTAVYAIGHASALLCDLSELDLGDRRLRDGDGAIRVDLDRPTFAELLAVAIDQPRRYGASDPAVLTRLVELLVEVAWRAPTSDQQRAVAEQLGLLEATIAEQGFDPGTRDRLAALAGQVRSAATKTTGAGGTSAGDRAGPNAR